MSPETPPAIHWVPAVDEVVGTCDCGWTVTKPRPLAEPLSFISHDCPLEEQ